MSAAVKINMHIATKMNQVVGEKNVMLQMEMEHQHTYINRVFRNLNVGTNKIIVPGFQDVHLFY